MHAWFASARGSKMSLNDGYAVFLKIPKERAVRLTTTPLPKFIAETLARQRKPPIKGASYQVRKLRKRQILNRLKRDMRKKKED